MKIDRIYIATHRLDFERTKACASSVRYWYPDIPIFLLKDYGSGTFSTSGIEHRLGVKILQTPNKINGWGYIKLEPLFLEDRHTFLILDSDTVMLGPVLETLRDVEADFVVDNEVQPETRFNEIYYNLYRINEINSDFRYPGYSFNSGQWIGTSGILKRADFEEVLNWSIPPQPKNPDIVFRGDQACLNYVLHWKSQKQEIKVERMPLMYYPNPIQMDLVPTTENLQEKRNNSSRILHWAGLGSPYARNFPHRDIYEFFSLKYYQDNRTKRKIMMYMHRWQGFIQLMRRKFS